MEKVNWAVLGTANIARNEVIPGMQMSEHCHLYAIAGRKPEKVNEFRQLFGFEKAYMSYDELLDDEQVEAVYIPLSNDLHKEWLIKAAGKKKHILCEKPLVATAEEVKEVIAVCKEEGVVFMEAFAYLHSPIIIDLIERVNTGVIGKIKLIETIFHIPKQSADDIRSRKETLGGSQYDVGCYNISLILKLMNEMPEKLSAVAQFTPAGIDEYCHTLLTFPSGAIATSACGMILDPTEPYRIDKCFIQGELGHIEVFVPYNACGELSYRISKDGEAEVVQMKVPNNYYLEIEQFNKCVRGIEEPFVSNEFSYQVAKVGEQILDQIGY